MSLWREAEQRKVAKTPTLWAEMLFPPPPPPPPPPSPPASRRCRAEPPPARTVRDNWYHDRRAPVIVLSVEHKTLTVIEAKIGAGKCSGWAGQLPSQCPLPCSRDQLQRIAVWNEFKSADLWLECLRCTLPLLQPVMCFRVHIRLLAGSHLYLFFVMGS